MDRFLTEQEFKQFRDLIYDESGIHFSESNRSILESRLKERLRKTNTETIDRYHRMLLDDKSEMKTLLDTVTTNLTRFFRNTMHFQTLENYVIPDLIKHKKETGGKSLKVWSAGCSTGEEPYSIAMVMKDKVPAEIQIEVTASDLSLKSLMTAKEGFYPQNKVNGVPEKYLKRFFEVKNGGYQVKDEIKQLVTFDYHNLKNDSGLRSLDIIFCRNVIIYFDEVAQKSVIEKFYEALNKHSYLFIGHSESLFGMKTKFEFLKTDWAVIYRKFLQ
ncbi:MAG TPA: protein-glutamate O-methyltransferase CheR [Sediminispirochaeta sp.]|nr:protein-glutamate O-methyltransferase CheR [Sediminispirochaeta sp.]